MPELHREGTDRKDKGTSIALPTTLMTVSPIAKTVLAFLAVIVVGFASLNSSEKEIFFENSIPPDSMTIRIYDGNMTSPDVDFKNRAKPVPLENWALNDNLTCVEEGLPTYPSEDDWQRRAPYALLIGAMKAGTTALSAYLEEHPNFVRTSRKEVHFFDFHFARFRSENVILRRGGRVSYAELFKQLEAGNLVEQNPAMISMDDSPRYLFWSYVIPARVLCVAPWVKIIAILRNPIDRAYSQFNMKGTERNSTVVITVPMSFEEWVQRDLDDLRRVGVIQDAIPLEEFSGSESELTAWKAYTRLGTHAPVGRGLYAIQLRHWFKAFEDFGKSRRDDFLIVHSEGMREHTKAVYQDILTFLNLPSFALPDAEEKFTGKYSEPLSEETRRKLDKFYAPYNRELYDLLGRQWKGVWDGKK